MNISAPFIKRPIGTSLLTLALLMSGILAFNFLPVAPLPQVEFPVIQVSAGLPGASPETMASAVATPLERQFGRIAGVNQMTSTSQLGSTSIVLQFDLTRNIDAAGRDVQAAINAARSQLPSYLPGNPTYRKVNPADAPIVILALTSDTVTLPKMYDAADSILGQKIAQINGVGQVFVGGGARPAVRAEVNPMQLNKLGVGLDTVRTALGSANANRPKGQLADDVDAWTLTANDQLMQADQYHRRHCRLQHSERSGGPVGRCRRRAGLGRRHSQCRLGQRKAGGSDYRFPATGREHYRHRRSHSGGDAAVAGVDFSSDPPGHYS